MKKLKTGIIGVGNIGTMHARDIAAGRGGDLVLTAVADINPDRLQWVRENLPGDIKTFSDGDALIESGLVDAVIVAVPHYDHPYFAIKCLERDIHVLVEKPSGVYTKQVRPMNEAAKKSKAAFAMMFNQRTDHVYRKMRELVQGGSLGNMRRSNWIITNWYRPQQYYDSGQWRATWAGEGGGVLLNQCPHNLDLWQWICGMPKKMTAHLHYGKWHDIEVEDDVTAYVEYENGATGVFVTSTADAPGTNRFEVTMDKGKLIAENGKLYLWELEMTEQEFSATSKEAFGAPKHEYKEVETDGLSPQHTGVLRAFANHVLYGEDLVAEGSEGINGLLISNAMHLSSWLGKTVEIPFDEDLFYEELMKRVRTSRHKDMPASAGPVDLSDTYNAGE